MRHRQRSGSAGAATPRSLSRRSFLALSAAVVVAACTRDGEAEVELGDTTPTSSTAPPSTTTPPASTAADTSVAATATTDPPPVATTAPLAADPFTLGVASGDPLADAVVVWTRLVGETLPEEVPVVVEVARDDRFTDVVTRLDATARLAVAHSVHVDVTGLEPDSWYWYRFSAGGFTSRVGRTRTMPAADALPERFVLGTASCQNWEDGFYAAHADIATSDIDCLYWLGDFIYEGAARPVGTSGSVRSHGTPEPTTLDGYRSRYELYASDAQLQAARAACPWIVTWDDHEVENNYAGLVSQDGADLGEFAARRAAAYRAWWEHQPVRLPAPEDGTDYVVYRESRIGRLADVSVLDTRQFRTDQACGDVVLSLEPACAETFAEGRTMLGGDQETWLLGRLGQSDAVWHVLAQQVIMANSAFGDAVLNYDQWDGYPAAREQILGYVADAGIENLVVLSGDIHFAGVALLRADAAMGAPVVGVEFVDTSISSAGNVDASLSGIVSAVGDVIDVELAHRGWTRHVLTPERWTAEYRIVTDAADPASPSTVWKVFEVPAGRAEVAEVVPA